MLGEFGKVESLIVLAGAVLAAYWHQENSGMAMAAAAVAVYCLLMRERQSINWERKDPPGTYNLKDVKAPHLIGWQLKAFGNLMKFPVVGDLLCNYLMKDQHYEIVRILAAQIEDTPMLQPIPPLSTNKDKDCDQHAFNKADGSLLNHLRGLLPHTTNKTSAYRHWTAGELERAYEAGTVTPSDVVMAVLKAVDKSNSGELPLWAITQMNKDDAISQAAASSKRWAQKKPLSPLDGVPIAVKEQTDVKGYVNTQGTDFLEAVKGVAAADGVMTARLRAAGAIIVGMTGMHEIGMGVVGFNKIKKAFRNPHHLGHYAGASSSGSGSAVAAGLIPIAIGYDGGGSVRIPASFNGVVGLKASFGRLPQKGQYSVTQGGPLAACARDAALAYFIMAGPHEETESFSQRLPAPHLNGFGVQGLSGIRVGMYRPYFEHAEKSVVDACYRMVEGMRGLGARTVDVVVNNLDEMRLAHIILISGEANTEYDKYFCKDSTRFLPDTELILRVNRQLTSIDFVSALKVRAWAMREMERVFQEVDVLALPTIGMTAPKISKGIGSYGESNTTQGSKIMRFCFLANLVGLPTISIPAGVDDAGLPIGFQLVAWHWQEHLLLRIANDLEAAGLSVQARPQAYFGDAVRKMIRA